MRAANKNKMAAIILVLSLITICSSVPIHNKDVCPTGCRCSVLQEPSSATTPAIFDQIDCYHGYLMTLSPNSTLCESLPPVRHFHINCAINDTIDGAISLADIPLAHPSIVETLSFTYCDIITKQEWPHFNLSRLIMLKSFEITHSNITSFELRVLFQSLPCANLETIRLSDINTGLDSLMENSGKDNHEMTTPEPVYQNPCSSHNITLLDLSNNGLTHLDWSIFPFVHVIKTLNLENNSLSNPPSLQELTEIEMIKLAHNNISHIKHNSFIDLPNLRIINASHNMISDPYMNLSGTPNINIVDLSYNGIMHLTVEFFQELYAVEELYLSHNSMLAITNTTEYYTFSFCPQLRIVDLLFNLLVEIDDSVFRYLPNLHKIDLGNNLITYISQNSFYQVGSLQHLNLANNRFTNFQKFPNLITVVDVDMLGNPLDCDCNMGNAIHSIGYNESLYSNWPHHVDFANQHFLNHTLLFCNEAHGYGYYPFPRLIFVADLLESQIQSNTLFFVCDYPERCPYRCSCFGYEDASRKKFITACPLRYLTEIPTNMYNGTTNLEVLGNSIQRIPSRIFADLNCLQTLDLIGNIVTIIEDDAFLGLGYLSLLRLSYNNLHEIKSSYFAHLKYLTQLELQYNHIAYIDQGSFSHLNYLVHLDLSGNNFAFLPDPFLQTKYITYLRLNNTNLVELPTVFIGKSNISDDSTYRDSWLPHLYLQDNLLTTIPEGLLDTSNMLHPWVNILLHNNQLTHLPKQLSKTRNPYVDVLTFSNNNLTTLSEGIFDNFQSNISIDLHDNPWNCNCSLSWLPNFLAGNKSRIRYPKADESAIYCDVILGEAKHVPLLNLTHDQFCPATKPLGADGVILISASSSMGCLLIVVVVGAIVVYRKRRYIRQHLRHYRIPGLAQIPPKEYEYKYDIFISYASQDIDFVLETLRPKFVEEKFKTYVFEVNSIPGTNQLESVQEAIEGAHRIVLVITQNYINNEQCAEYEFNQALIQSMRERMDTLLIIQLENLDPEVVPINIREYMGKKNWIKYREMDNAFWDKVFEQLPKPRNDLKPDALDIALQNLPPADEPLEA
ncbi:uncharacterized protein [Amphiura filiformis]|uniref:uncharacterized protein n=1 Tax=Amphiura filiformis TaxID=82378 RepID=UPI003B21C35F